MDLLTVARGCHNSDPWSDSTLTPFIIQIDGKEIQIGFLLPEVVKQICDDVKAAKCTTLHADPSAEDASMVTNIKIDPQITSNDEISAAMKTIVERWRDEKLFPDPLKGRS
jgi:hypothetical protein